MHPLKLKLAPADPHMPLFTHIIIISEVMHAPKLKLAPIYMLTNTTFLTSIELTHVLYMVYMENSKKSLKLFCT